MKMARVQRGENYGVDQLRNSPFRPGLQRAEHVAIFKRILRGALPPPEGMKMAT
jgi:hypothetical protein